MDEDHNFLNRTFLLNILLNSSKLTQNMCQIVMVTIISHKFFPLEDLIHL